MLTFTPSAWVKLKDSSKLSSRPRPDSFLHSSKQNSQQMSTHLVDPNIASLYLYLCYEHICTFAISLVYTAALKPYFISMTWWNIFSSSSPFEHWHGWAENFLSRNSHRRLLSHSYRLLEEWNIPRSRSELFRPSLLGRISIYDSTRSCAALLMTGPIVVLISSGSHSL